MNPQLDAEGRPLETAEDPADAHGRTLAELVSEQAQRFLLVGQAEEDGRRRGAAAMDWFVFPAGLFGEMPPFAIGRACFDNWLVWKARQVGIVVDGTHDVRAFHQPHGNEHVDGGMDEAYYGEEAARNLELAGGKSRLYTLHDASHVLRGRSEEHTSELQSR